jgi:hypothetical protein
MKQFRVWGLSAALAAGLGSQAVAADPNMQPDQTTLIQKLFAPRPPKPTGPTVPPAPLTITAPLSPEVLAKAVQAEEIAYLRRVGVCDELRRVAFEKGDSALSRQADELERKADIIFKARIAALGVPASRPSLSDSIRITRLEEPLPPQAAASRLTAPVSPVPVQSTAEVVREVKP